MNIGSRRTLIAVTAAVAVAGGAAAWAGARHGGDAEAAAVSAGSPVAVRSQDGGAATQPERGFRRAAGGDHLPGARGGQFLDDVAKHLGIDRSKLDAALSALATDDVDWAVANGFLTKEQGDAMKTAIAGGAGAMGHGMRMGKGMGMGLLGGGITRSGFSAAAAYLGLAESELRTALATKTLARVASDRGTSVDGLKQAIHDAAKADLDAAAKANRFTQKQADALLVRFDGVLDDVVNGRSPELTRLAGKLGVDRAKVEAAYRAAAVDGVDRALAAGLITKEQADAIKKRIEAGNGFGGPGFGRGFGPGPGMGGPGGHGGRHGHGDAMPDLGGDGPHGGAGMPGWRGAGGRGQGGAGGGWSDSATPVPPAA